MCSSHTVERHTRKCEVLGPRLNNVFCYLITWSGHRNDGVRTLYKPTSPTLSDYNQGRTGERFVLEGTGWTKHWTTFKKNLRPLLFLCFVRGVTVHSVRVQCVGIFILSTPPQLQHHITACHKSPPLLFVQTSSWLQINHSGPWPPRQMEETGSEL